MTLDNFKNVNFNVGQEARAVDTNDAQQFALSRVFDQILHELAPGSLLDNGDPEFRSPDLTATKYAYALTATGGAPIISAKQHVLPTDKKVRISAGTVMQRIGAANGNTPQLIPFTFDGTLELTMNDGHATLSRVDMVQMKLEWINDDTQSRVFATEGEHAILNLDPIMVNMSTTLRARVEGLSGNQIRVRFVSAGALSIVESGYDVTINYNSGVTTVAQVEALITSTSTLIAIDSVGNGTDVLTNPGDTLAYTNLAGGIDTVLVSQNMSMKQRVSATISIKPGTAVAAPAIFPDPDPGYVPLFVCVIPPTWSAAAGYSMSYDDRPVGAVSGKTYATVMDLRMPINVKKYTTTVQNCFYDEHEWFKADVNGNTMGLMASGLGASAIGGEYVTVSVGGTGATVGASDYQMNVSGFSIFNNAGDCAVNIPIPPQLNGDQLITSGYEVVSASYQISGNSSADLTAVNLLHKQSGNAGAGFSYWATSDNNPPPAVTFKNSGPISIFVAPGDSLYFVFTANAFGIEIINASVVMRLNPKGHIPPSPNHLNLIAPCAPDSGRLIGLNVIAQSGGLGPFAQGFISGLSLGGPSKDLVRVAGIGAGGLFTDDGLPRRKHVGIDVIEAPAETKNLVGKGSASFGCPVWLNGQRAMFRTMTEKYLADENEDASSPAKIALRIPSFSEFVFFSVTFYVAEGL